MENEVIDVVEAVEAVDEKSTVDAVVEAIKGSEFKTGLIAGAAVLATGGLAIAGYFAAKAIKKSIDEKKAKAEENVEVVEN